MKCPNRKNTALKERKLKDQSIRLDTCPKCKGIWFDAGEFEHVLETAIKELTIPRKAKRSGAHCPRCIEPLYAFNYPQTLVEIDMCKRCLGFWLNAGEFKEIQTVRKNLARYNELEEYDSVPGIKGTLIDWINTAIESLMSY